MLTVGIGFMLRGLASMVPGWGTETYAIKTPYSGEVLRAGGLALSAEYLMVIVMTILLCSALYAYFRFTRIGVAMQAASQNQLAAYYMGIPVARVNTLVWAISAAVAGFAALLLAPITFVHTNMGFIGLKAFPAAVIGGFGSVPGAIAGGLIIGVVEALAGFYLPEGFKDIAAYIVVLVVLMVRPHGLFGGAARKKV
jgi:branched-chain amino acid transport system permease protein